MKLEFHRRFQSDLDNAACTLPSRSCRLEINNFDFLDRMIRPKENRLPSDDKNLHRTSNFVAFNVIARAKRIIRQLVEQPRYEQLFLSSACFEIRNDVRCDEDVVSHHYSFPAFSISFFQS